MALMNPLSSVSTGALCLACACLTFTGNSAAGGLTAKIRYTEYGIPHVLAGDYPSLGFGQGYASARDNLCRTIEGAIMTSAERSRYFGAEAGFGNYRALIFVRSNLSSDLYFKALAERKVIENLLAKPAPFGPRQEVREMVAGYVAGFNKYLSEGHRSSCSGAQWVRPLADIDVWRRMYAIATFTGSGMLAELIVSAQPPVHQTPSAATSGIVSPSAPWPFVELAERHLATNTISIGARASASGRGINVANPHLPWETDARWHQIHLSIPGKLNVNGTALMGTPLVALGHTEALAWSGTTSETVRSFVIYKLKLAADSPTSYLVDGKPESMRRHEISVAAKQPDGTVKTITHTQWTTRYGPVIGPGFAGIDLSWTSDTAYVLSDAGTGNLRTWNTLFGWNHAQSSREALQVIRDTQGMPWWHMSAADKQGEVLYSNMMVVPHLTDKQAARCATATLGHHVVMGNGFTVLDGSRSECALESDKDALQPGIFGPGDPDHPRMPVMLTDDYATNSNESYWLTNARQPLVGFPDIFGEVSSPRSTRTRGALTEIADQLADGKFTLQAMQDLVLSNRSFTGELAAADTLKLCGTLSEGMAQSSDGKSVSVREACAALALWDRRMNIDSRGALVFDRFWRQLAKLSGDTWSATRQPELWKAAFDPKKPIDTPRGLEIANPIVEHALADAVLELRPDPAKPPKIPFDARLGEYQYVERGGVRTPVGGGGGLLGVFNAYESAWDPDRGYFFPVSTSTYMHIVAFNATKCPDIRTLTTYSQSSDPTSPHYNDQLELYSKKRWVVGRFCEQDVLASPALETIEIAAPN